MLDPTIPYNKLPKIPPHVVFEDVAILKKVSERSQITSVTSPVVQ